MSYEDLINLLKTAESAEEIDRHREEICEKLSGGYADYLQ